MKNRPFLKLSSLCLAFNLALSSFSVFAKVPFQKPETTPTNEQNVYSVVRNGVLTPIIPSTVNSVQPAGPSIQPNQHNLSEKDSKEKIKKQTKSEESKKSLLKKCNEFFAEPIYKMPVLQTIHDKAMQPFGIKDLYSTLKKVPQKAGEFAAQVYDKKLPIIGVKFPKAIEFLVRTPFKKNVLSYLTKQYFAKKLEKKVLGTFLDKPQDLSWNVVKSFALRSIAYNIIYNGLIKGSIKTVTSGGDWMSNVTSGVINPLITPKGIKDSILADYYNDFIKEVLKSDYIKEQMNQFMNAD